MFFLLLVLIALTASPAAAELTPFSHAKTSQGAEVVLFVNDYESGELRASSIALQSGYAYWIGKEIHTLPIQRAIELPRELLRPRPGVIPRPKTTSPEASPRPIPGSLLQRPTVPSAIIPEATALVYPVPFSPGVHDRELTIYYSLPEAQDVEIFIYSVTGELVKRTYIPQGMEGGKKDNNAVRWDGMTDRGELIPTGIHTGFVFSRQKSQVIARFRVVVSE